MAEPNKNDYKSLGRMLAKHAKPLLEDGSPKRKMDDNKAKDLFRSAVRKVWMYSPNKLHFLNSQRVADTDPTTRRKWKYQCNKCKNFFSQDSVDVDHKEGENSFTEWVQAFDYASSILDVGRGDLQLLCNKESRLNCHATKTTCERIRVDWTDPQGWSIGIMEQERVRICKLKAALQKSWLESKGIAPAPNKEGRVAQIKDRLIIDYDLSGALRLIGGDYYEQ